MRSAYGALQLFVGLLFVLDQLFTTPRTIWFPVVPQNVTLIYALKILLDALLLAAGGVGLIRGKRWGWYLTGIMIMGMAISPIVEAMAGLAISRRLVLLPSLRVLFYLVDISLLFIPAIYLQFFPSHRPPRKLLLPLIMFLGLVNAYGAPFIWVFLVRTLTFSRGLFLLS